MTVRIKLKNSDKILNFSYAICFYIKGDSFNIKYGGLNTIKRIKLSECYSIEVFDYD